MLCLGLFNSSISLGTLIQSLSIQEAGPGYFVRFHSSNGLCNCSNHIVVGMCLAACF